MDEEESDGGEDDDGDDYLLPRGKETSFHRTLRRLLRETAANRAEWEDEVIEMAEFVGRYCTALGEVEDEMREGGIGGLGRRGRGRGRGQGGGSGNESGSDSGSDSGSESGSDSESDASDPSDQEDDGKDIVPSSAPQNTLAILAALRDLDETYHLLEKAQSRVMRRHDLLVKLKDELRQVQRDWSQRRETVQWGLRSGDEFVDAAVLLILQVQLQTAQLSATLKQLYSTACSPMGALHDGDGGDGRGSGCSSEVAAAAVRKWRRYDPTRASAKRKEILLVWRDLPHVERGSGSQSFTWWREVWQKEVGRWNE